MSGGKRERTHFINVDLEIYGKSGIANLIASLEKSVVVLGTNNKFTAMELLGATSDLDKTVAKFCKLIQSLPDDSAAVWNRLKKRVLNIGIQAGEEPKSANFVISKKTLALAASIGTEIEITVYAPYE
jgi:hypothetical protein